MEIKPKLAVTGYRGIWGKDLNEQIAFEYVRSYARMIASLPSLAKVKRVVVGRDTRLTGANIFQSVREALEKENIEIINAGIVPTPSILLLVKKLKLDGGIMITASHNPIEYNGIKFILSPGRLTNEGEVKAIEKFRKELTMEEKMPSVAETKNINTNNEEFRKIHTNEIVKNIDADLIRSKKFKVTLDPVNGAGSIITQELLQELGCEVSVINERQDGSFAHPPEPLPQNLDQIAEAVKKNKSDIGFAQDPDADRLVVVNEKGEVINEECTLALAVKNVLSSNKGDIVINMSTSRMSEDIAHQYGRKVFKTKIGEGNVVEKLISENGVIGGEGSSGAIYPKINTARDSLVGIALVLELVAKENKKISEIVDSLPKYFMKKDKIPIKENLAGLLNKFKKQFPDATINELDGVRFDWPDSSWLHVRASITEPIIRMFGEAKTADRIETLFNEARLTLRA